MVEKNESVQSMASGVASVNSFGQDKNPTGSPGYKVVLLTLAVIAVAIGLFGLIIYW